MSWYRPGQIRIQIVSTLPAEMDCMTHVKQGLNKAALCYFSVFQAAGSVSSREGPLRSSSTPLMDRLRRMSNPRYLFQTEITGL